MKSEMKENKLTVLGYDDFFESQRKELELDSASIARVISEHKGGYIVRGEDGEYTAKVKGRDMFYAKSREDYPAVGDWVVVERSDEENVVIARILSRKSVLKRKRNNRDEIQVIAANIDSVFIIESVDRDYNLNRLERYIALAQDGHMRSIVVLNKIDLVSDEELKEKVNEIQARFRDVTVISASTVSEQGLCGLADVIKPGMTYCFFGSSGVGKSSLINRLLGGGSIEVGDIGHHSGRGKHTTTRRNMYFLEGGGIVIDNPGVREVGVMDTDIDSGDVFAQIIELSKGCKYSDCMHISEPGCVVLQAVEEGNISRDKYSSYIKLKKESDHYAMTKVEKRKKDRKFGKFIKRTLEQSKKYTGDR